jgi:drug/metabolite transporter (DMT)-like permease
MAAARIRRALTVDRLYRAALISAALMVVGSFGPWARAFTVTVSGVDGDGWFVIAAAAVAAIALYRYRRSDQRWLWIVAALMGLVGLGVVGYDGREIFGYQGGDEDDFSGEVDLVQPAWGLFVAVIASAGLTATSILLHLVRQETVSAVADGSPASDDAAERRTGERPAAQP